MRFVPTTPIDELDEKAWDAQLFATKDGLAGSLGWKLNYHVLRSKGSQAGFPDRVLVRDRVLFVETKREGGKPSPAQVKWLDGLARAGAEAYLWQPSDLKEIARVLSRRWTFNFFEDGPHLAGAGACWQPGSLWLIGGRSDSERSSE